MAITSMDGLVTALARSPNYAYFFPSGTTAAGGQLFLNRIATNTFGQAAIPPDLTLGGHIPTRALIGFPNIPSPAVGETLYLAQLGGTFSVAGSLVINDRIWAASGFNGTLTTPQIVTSFPALPAERAPGNGLGLEIWLEGYTPIGATASNVTVTYTNSDGVAGRVTTSEAILASFPAARRQRLRLQDGDFGVSSIESVTLSASTGTAGNFAVVLCKRYTAAGVTLANTSVAADFAALGLPQIPTDAALEFLHYATTTTSGIIQGSFNVVSG